MDGSEGSRSALAWAAAEAAAAGADLRLVAVADETPLSPRFPVRLNHAHATKLLDELAASVSGVVPRSRSARSSSTVTPRPRSSTTSTAAGCSWSASAASA